MTKDESPAGPEYGSVQAWGSKKANYNHLLNFRFESRDAVGGRGQGSAKGWGRRRTGGSIPYNKERFLQAKLVCCNTINSNHKLWSEKRKIFYTITMITIICMCLKLVYKKIRFKLLYISLGCAL